MLIVTRKTLDEIFFLKDKYYKETAEDVFGGKLNEYDDDDEFYSDGVDIHIPVDEAENLLDYDECRQYLEDCELINDFEDYSFSIEVIERRLLRAIDTKTDLIISFEDIRSEVFDYVSQDIEQYLEWYFGGRNEN